MTGIRLSPWEVGTIFDMYDELHRAVKDREAELPKLTMGAFDNEFTKRLN